MTKPWPPSTSIGRRNLPGIFGTSKFGNGLSARRLIEHNVRYVAAVSHGNWDGIRNGMAANNVLGK